MRKTFNATDEEIFEYHVGGKIGTELKKDLKDQKDLSIAYTPGVSKVCEAIQKNDELAYSYTSKGNVVAVVTDGTAVLGLGNIGTRASLPVMEGKAVLFKAFAGVDAWPVTIEAVNKSNSKTDIDKFVEIVSCICGNYGGVNLEDIASPACFEIEDRLDSMLNIPVFHDDQWGTAIITLAAFKNYCLITGKQPGKISVVINGAGAAGLRIAQMLKTEGLGECLICDSKGVLRADRDDLNIKKREHAVDTKKTTLSDAIKGADVFVGVSVGGCVSKDMILSMNDYPGIFAMANPVPEILPEEVSECMKGQRYIMATGRSDYPNQVNNVLGFPFIFRGALDVRAEKITMGMKIAASEALADLAREENIPEVVRKAYNKDFVFGPDYIIPTPFDPRIKDWESKAVAQAALRDGVANIYNLKM